MVRSCTTLRIIELSSLRENRRQSQSYGTHPMRNRVDDKSLALFVPIVIRYESGC